MFQKRWIVHLKAFSNWQWDDYTGSFYDLSECNKVVSLNGLQMWSHIILYWKMIMTSSGLTTTDDVIIAIIKIRRQ